MRFTTHPTITMHCVEVSSINSITNRLTKTSTGEPHQTLLPSYNFKALHAPLIRPGNQAIRLNVLLDYRFNDTSHHRSRPSDTTSASCIFDNRKGIAAGFLGMSHQPTPSLGSGWPCEDESASLRFSIEGGNIADCNTKAKIPASFKLSRLSGFLSAG